MMKNDLKIMDKADKRELVARLSKIEGQIRAIINMIEKEESCDIVIHQLAAVKQAIHKTFTNAVSKILENNCCINDRESDEYKELKEKISSVSKLIEKYL
ncbi:MAG: metal-sensitive transcriptional regulator, partial [Candidatus Calescibacterium sp.]|nr:metal-sensitive transcriptional regulator [Candidatus Calescibacterium sp.]MCX7758359.1 metal-sensitive transcriptional regulator [bacterium]